MSSTCQPSQGSSRGVRHAPAAEEEEDHGGLVDVRFQLANVRQVVHIEERRDGWQQQLHLPLDDRRLILPSAPDV